MSDGSDLSALAVQCHHLEVSQIKFSNGLINLYDIMYCMKRVSWVDYHEVLASSDTN